MGDLGAPLADHGDIVSALPFVAPMIVIVIGLLVFALRDRARRRRDSTTDDDGGS